jgi:hypothetical protein
MYLQYYKFSIIVKINNSLNANRTALCLRVFWKMRILPTGTRYKTELTLANEAMTTWKDDGMITIRFVSPGGRLIQIPGISMHIFISNDLHKSRNMQVADNI